MSFEEILTETLQCYDYLYIPTHKHYRDVNMKDDAWKEVAQRMESTGTVS